MAKEQDTTCNHHELRKGLKKITKKIKKNIRHLDHKAKKIKPKKSTKKAMKEIYCFELDMYKCWSDIKSLSTYEFTKYAHQVKRLELIKTTHPASFKVHEIGMIYDEKKHTLDAIGISGDYYNPTTGKFDGGKLGLLFDYLVHTSYQSNGTVKHTRWVARLMKKLYFLNLYTDIHSNYTWYISRINAESGDPDESSGTAKGTG